MKKMKLALIISMILFNVPAWSQEKDKDVMVKKIFTMLQQKNQEGFVKLFPDVVTLRQFAEKVLTGDQKTLLDEMLPMLTDSNMQLKYREIYAGIMEKAEQKGIDWNQAKMVSFTADSSADQERKMTTLNGKIYFNATGKEYFMTYSETLWFENHGWYGVVIDRIDEKSKENEPEENTGFEDMDSVRMIMDTAIAIPDTAIKNKEIKPVKKITPAKQKGKPVREKTQTPARKPD
jgi:hypothetical protein